ncbi:BREX-2 system adenine-specific DNA-methyltransferase PglX [Nocardia sp. NPDC004278]
MIHGPSLLTDLRRQLAVLESDLMTQTAQDVTDNMLRSKWSAVCAAGRSSATYSSWLAEQVTQAALAWLLGTVFLRFCEDNHLIAAPYLSGPGTRCKLAQNRQSEFSRMSPSATDRDWLLQGLADTYPIDPTMDIDHGPLAQIPISVDAATNLIAFWRSSDAGGMIVHDFTDVGLDTRFLGDLYQDLSDQERQAYALLQTPEFVVDFVLDQVLARAIDEFGLDGLRVVDPVCGSGTFILGAFDRLLTRWRKQEPDATPWESVHRALASVHGVDRNPNAVSIARFRLHIAAMKAGGARCLSDQPHLELVLVVGDSLLNGRNAMTSKVSRPTGSNTSRDEDSAGMADTDDLLGAGSYHVVVGNPPYITMKDKALSETYRRAYPICRGTYALTVPFIQRFFSLAKPNSEGAGFVGLLSANSFMKREFGRSLIEEFLPTVDLTDVIDTSGAFIPGHGIPTVLLFGRNRPPSHSRTKVTIGILAESEKPVDPRQGNVWKSIVDGVNRGGVYQDKWTQRIDFDQSMLHIFPWNLTDSASASVLDAMKAGDVRLEKIVARIGYYANTGLDDAFIAPAASFRRKKAESTILIPMLRGSEIRDWTAIPEDTGVMLTAGSSDTPKIENYPHVFKLLWPLRTILEHRRGNSGRTFFDEDRPWYQWHHVTEVQDAHPWWVVLAWVSTHNHFAVLRERAAPLTSAPVIRLPKSVANSDVLQLTALLNSSLLCFWLKHNSNSKGQPGVGQTGIGEPWSFFYEFAGQRLGEVPVPPGPWPEARWSVHAKRMDELAQELAHTDPRSVLQPGASFDGGNLGFARMRWRAARGRLIGLQEELDWEIYEKYGLIAADGLLAPADLIPELRMGERAFEIVLARRMAQGETHSNWFERNGVVPITTLPRQWPAAYRQIVEARIDAIELHPSLNRVEQPEFKRRWSTVEWDTLQNDSLRSWLLDRMEDRNLWFREDSRGTEQPWLRTIQELIETLSRDEDFASAAAFYDPDTECRETVRRLIEDEHVPFLAAFRYKESGYRKRKDWERVWTLQREADAAKAEASPPTEPIPVPPKYKSADFARQSYWRARGKLDVPNERFISYPVDNRAPTLFGWAGWDHREQAAALMVHIEKLLDQASTSEQLMPLLAGLLELHPWVAQWHNGFHLRYQEFLCSVQSKFGLTDEELVTWRPPAPKRGRPRKTPSS